MLGVVSIALAVVVLYSFWGFSLLSATSGSTETVAVESQA